MPLFKSEDPKNEGEIGTQFWNGNWTNIQAQSPDKDHTAHKYHVIIFKTLASSLDHTQLQILLN